MFRVLLVDDEELALISLRYSIPWKEYGFSDVQISQDAESALQSLCKGRIDAAFVDIRMPGLSGLELMQAARENGTETLFVVVSGYADFAYAQEAIRQGVLDYCLKPVDPEETIPILKQLSEQLLSRRLTKDPQEILKLLSDEEFCHHFLKAILPDCRITRWNDRAVDIISRGGGKVVGIKQYLEENDILPQETMAFGDGENDIEMLEAVGIGIAMGNADDIVKKSADYVTDSVDNDGIGKALRYFQII